MGSMKLVRIAAQPDQLYDLATDPREISDLAPADSKSTARMAGVLDTWFKVVVPLAFPGAHGPEREWPQHGTNSTSAGF